MHNNKLSNNYNNFKLFTVSYSSRSKDTPIVLPSAPRAARDLSVNEENIPNNPPFVAYISNLPYDVDEEDLVDFFADMNVCFKTYTNYYYLSNNYL